MYSYMRLIIRQTTLKVNFKVSPIDNTFFSIQAHLIIFLLFIWKYLPISMTTGNLGGFLQVYISV